MSARRVALGFGAVTILLIPVAYASMFSVLNAYDDEGYFLMTMRDYLSGQALYTQIYTVYGPFFYEVLGGVFKLFGLEVGHDAGRVVTLVIWLAASVSGGLAVYRLTRNLLLGLGGQFVTFHVLAALTSEPMQPSGVLSLLLVGLAGAAAYRSRWPRATAVLIGAFVAAACLVKINVGIFAGLAVAFAFTMSLWGRWRSWIGLVTAHLLVAVPIALMSEHFGQEWVFEYAAVVVLSAEAVLLVCFYGLRPRQSPASLGWLVAGAAVLGTVCVGVAILGGTHPADVFTSLVVAPARLALLYQWPLRINPGYVIWAVAVMVVGLILGLRARQGHSPAVPALARIAAGAFTLFAILLLPSSIFFLALPLAFVAVIDPRPESVGPTDPYARLLLPALAVIESVQAFPIAGTQLSMAALLLVPMGAITLNDGILQLREWTHRSPRRLLTVASWAAPAVLIANLGFYQLFGFLAVSEYQSTVALGLPGAESVRVAPERAAALRSMVAAINDQCSSFITLPGMPSFYLWTGQQPPAQLYAGVWMYSLNDAQQQQVVANIQGLPRLCVVKDQAVVDFWAEGRPVPSRPLVEYIANAFKPDRAFGDYELLVKR